MSICKQLSILIENGKKTDGFFSTVTLAEGAITGAK